MHDIYEDDAEERIKPEEWRKPRVVVLDQSADGSYSWGELTNGDCGQVVDTTLTAVVFDPIERLARQGLDAGTVVVDGIKYVFVVSRKR